MSGNGSTIEAEVIEIDGVAVQPRPMREESAKGAPWARWGDWQGQVKRLDLRWWPLWAVLGAIALVAVVAVGMCFAVIFVTWQIFKAILRAIANLFRPQR